jgi:hypothetical protein
VEARFEAGKIGLMWEQQRGAIADEGRAQLDLPTSVFGIVPAGLHAGHTGLEPGKI